jgi:hypothetical protein
MATEKTTFLKVDRNSQSQVLRRYFLVSLLFVALSGCMPKSEETRLKEFSVDYFCNYVKPFGEQKVTADELAAAENTLPQKHGFKGKEEMIEIANRLKSEGKISDEDLEKTLKDACGYELKLMW